jgi:hypothetical protein
MVKLAGILSNGVEIAPGDRFPVGWDPATGDRIYETATAVLLQEARRLRSNIDQ